MYYVQQTNVLHRLSLYVITAQLSGFVTLFINGLPYLDEAINKESDTVRGNIVLLDQYY